MLNIVFVLFSLVAVAPWEGIELPQSQIVESNTTENLRIGYVPDEW